MQPYFRGDFYAEILQRLRKGICMTGSIPILGKIAIEALDIWVIALYFVFILGVDIWAGLKRRGETESKGYFLAGGTLTWPLIGMALFSQCFLIICQPTIANGKRAFC
jgi:hypothetical protein